VSETSEPHYHACLDFVGEELDPDDILPLVPLKADGPKKKGDPLFNSRNGKTSHARFGACIFYTTGVVCSSNLSDHVVFLLNNIEPTLEKIKNVVDRQNLRWFITCFLDSPDEKLETLLSPAIFMRAAEFGIPIEVEDFSGVTFVWDYPPPAP